MEALLPEAANSFLLRLVRTRQQGGSQAIGPGGCGQRPPARRTAPSQPPQKTEGRETAGRLERPPSHASYATAPGRRNLVHLGGWIRPRGFGRHHGTPPLVAGTARQRANGPHDDRAPENRIYADSCDRFSSQCSRAPRCQPRDVTKFYRTPDRRWWTVARRTTWTILSAARNGLPCRPWLLGVRCRRPEGRRAQLLWACRVAARFEAVHPVRRSRAGLDPATLSPLSRREGAEGGRPTRSRHRAAHHNPTRRSVPAHPRPPSTHRSNFAGWIIRLASPRSGTFTPFGPFRPGRSCTASPRIARHHG